MPEASGTAGEAARTSTPHHRRLRAARVVVGAIAVLAVIALVVLALATDPARSTTMRRPARVVLRSTPAPAQAALPPPAPQPATSVPQPPPASEVQPSAPAPTSTAPPAVAPESRPATAAPEAAVKQCALGLPPPARNGGLQSLIGLVPAFGPFSAEAFAFAPAYEPLLKVFGPFLPLLNDVAVTNDPAYAPLIELLQKLEGTGFEALQPIYGPYRPAVLDAAKTLANTFAPGTKALAEAPGIECIQALEGLLAGGS